MDALKTDPNASCNSLDSRNRVLKSLALAAVVGGVLSSIASHGCILFAGAGHGATSPGHLFFGPVLAYWQLGRFDTVVYARYLPLTTIILYAYYSVYAVAISVGRIWGHGRIALVLVLVFHYCGVLVCMMSDEWDGLQNIGRMAEALSGVLTVFMFELFVLLHVLAFQYASSRIPYRPRLTRHVKIILTIGLLAGLLLYVYTMLNIKY